jgi:hypothetical protein
MNLIEQQQKARALPMQYLQQAANGQSVELAPWIATAELQRRTTADQHMQAAQGAQGPQPTVKDQIEQKAGLMATQAAQQAQVQAQQAQQSAQPKAPVPGDTPQPELQPEEPIMAAGGGLMNAPVNFQFAHGGILGYAGDEPQGSKVEDPNAAQLASDRKAVLDGLKKFGYATEDIVAMPFRAASALLNTLIVRPARAVSGADIPYFPMMGGGDNRSVTPYSDRAYQEKQVAKPAPAASTSGAGRGGQGGPSATDLAGILSALPKAPPSPQRTPVPKPQVEQAQAPAQSQAQPQTASPLEQALIRYSTSETPQASLQGAIGNEQALAKAYNLDQPMGVEERAIIAQRNAAREAARKREAGDAFSAWVSGLVGVPGAAGMAYSQARQAQDAAEREHLSGNLKDIRDLNTAQRAALEKRATTAGSEFNADKLATATAAQNKATVGANVYGTQKQAESSKYSADSHAKASMEIAKLQERMATLRAGSAEARQAASELRDRERAIEADIKALTSQRNKLSGSFTPADRKELEYVDAELRNAREQHALVRGDKGAAPNATMTPPPPGAVRLKKG